MLIGHYAPALVMQRARPTVPLWALMVAVQFVDFLWSGFVLTGIEHARIAPGFTASNDLDLWDMPWSHSVVATLAWSALVFVGWRLVSKRPTRTGDALVVAAAVASHFVLDLLVHVHDLPVFDAQGTKLGLGLWDHKLLAIVVEVGLFAGAALYWWLPRRASPGARGAAIWLGAMTLFAIGFYVVPTPPTTTLAALSALATYVAVAWLAAWADRRTAPPAEVSRRPAA